MASGLYRVKETIKELLGNGFAEEIRPSGNSRLYRLTVIGKQEPSLEGICLIHFPM